jgi:hypothetical protein
MKISVGIVMFGDLKTEKKNCGDEDGGKSLTEGG